MNKKITTAISFTLFLVLFVNSQTIWDGPTITFTKANNADWTLEANQDRMTPNVWLTRADDQGQFNIKVQSAYSGGGPTDTEWGWGTTADIGSITFRTWKSTTKDNNPNGDHTNMVGFPLVVHLISEDIYIDLTYNSWTAGGGGGFSYTRSTDSGLAVNDFELANKVKVYPNPTSDYLYTENLQSQQLDIFNILGKKMMKLDYNGNAAINIKSLPNGLYFLITESKSSIKFIKI
jgi:hypothetical protein